MLSRPKLILALFVISRIICRVWLSSHFHQLLMRQIIFVLLCVLSLPCFGQQLPFEELLDSGKTEYKRQLEGPSPDFRKATALLERAVKVQPRNTTARYFLGYSIDKQNSSSGEEMNMLCLSETIRASEQFEYINKVEPAYKGEILVLDPYAKISAIWGSQALAYLNKGRKDSAQWALQEGKKRGGFLEPVLAFNRHLLHGCESNSLLVTNGDNITFSVLYLQLVENLRPDLSFLDINLLHTAWYPKLLKRENKIPISYNEQELDSVTYSKWTPTPVTVEHNQPAKSFTWMVKPSYMADYLLRGDKILLDIFKQTIFKKQIYFSEPKPDSSMNLSLEDHLFTVGLHSALRAGEATFNQQALQRENLKNYEVVPAHAVAIRNSPSTVEMLNNFRVAYYLRIYDVLEQDRTEARNLFAEMNKKFPESLLPFTQFFKEHHDRITTLVADK